jgi:hypothetical protein
VTGLLLSVDRPRVAVGQTIAYQIDVRINGWNGMGPLPGNGVPEEVDVLLWQTPLGRLDAGEGPYWGDYRYIAIEPEADTFRFRGQLEAVGAGRVLVWVGKFDDGIASAPVEIEIVPVVGDAGALEGSEARP